MSRKIKYEIVPESEYTDFSEREGGGKLLGAGIAVTASLSTFAITRIVNHSVKASTVVEALPPPSPPVFESTTDPFNVLIQPDGLQGVTAYPEMIQTGFFAESTLDLLANVLDPVVQILVAISFPIASVIMVGACFFFMLGNSEKAWQIIFNAGLGYVLIQMSPLFLSILREIGKAI